MDRAMKNTMKNSKDMITIMWRLDRMLVLLTMANAMIQALIPFVGIYLSAYVLDGLGTGQEKEELLTVVLMAVGLVFFLMILSSYLKKHMDIRTDVCAHRYDMERSRRTLTMDYELLDSPLVNDLRTRIHNDGNWGAGFYSVIGTADLFVQACFNLVAAFLVLLPLFADGEVFRTPLTLALVFGFVGIISFSTWFLLKATKRIFGLLDENSNEFTYLEYFLYRTWDCKMGKDVRIYKGQGLIENYMREDMRERWIKKATASESGRGLVSGGSAGLLQAFAYLFVVVRAVSGALTVGALMKYAAAIYRFSQALACMFRAGSSFVAYAGRNQSTMEYLDVKDVLYRGSLPVEKGFFCEERDNDYEIEFCNVSFRYPSSRQYALKDFSFKFRTGERLAVVGRNGSGKTTFIKLLCRLYDPTEGEILLNGINIKKYDYEEYKAIFSVVFQDFKLFSFSLGENVGACVSYDEEKAVSCLEKAGLGQRLKELEKGVGTYLYKNFDEDGIEISGGEAQKMALARALYKDAPFMILDEPTAALDPVAEYEIYSRFNEIVGEKTAVYISHRLSSCRFCDDIAVFDEGRLVQRGSHEELVADRDGKYYELWQAQAQYYEGEQSTTRF